MRSARCEAAVLALVATVATAQEFPGEGPAPTAFPVTVSLYGLGGWSGDRALRTYNVGVPDPNDPACDSVAVQCQTIRGLSGSAGIGARIQVPVSRRMGLRVGLSYFAPKRVEKLLDGSQTRIDNDRVQVLRGEALFLFRLKPQVPVFFGAGGTLARLNPGPSPGQETATEYGGVLVMGFDHRFSPTMGLRVEWDAHFVVPEQAPGPTEDAAKSFAFDHQLSVGVTYRVSVKRR